MRTIEEIIQSSETEKEIPVSDVAWRRLERKLDKHDRSFRQTKVIYRSVAAVAAVIVFLLLLPAESSGDLYHTTDLKATSAPLFSKDDVSALNKLFPEVYFTDLNG